jgi:hypothetical protein
LLLKILITALGVAFPSANDLVNSDADTSVVTPAAGSAAYVWVYNKDATNYIKIKLAGTELLRVGPGEANLICVDSSRACALRADTATCKCEYGYFTLDKY